MIGTPVSQYQRLVLYVVRATQEVALPRCCLCFFFIFILRILPPEEGHHPLSVLMYIPRVLD